MKKKPKQGEDRHFFLRITHDTKDNIQYRTQDHSHRPVDW